MEREAGTYSAVGPVPDDRSRLINIQELDVIVHDMNNHHGTFSNVMLIIPEMADLHHYPNLVR